MTTEPYPERAAARPGLTAKHVLLILLLLALATLGTFAVGYFRLVYYEPQAAQHLPADAVLVAHLDVEQVVLFEPVRRHIFPALNGGMGEPSLRSRFEQQADVNSAMDLREIALAWFDDGHWLAVIGGLFPRRGLVETLADVLAEDGRFDCQLQAPTLHCGEVIFEQAADGVIVLGSAMERVRQALRPTSPHRWVSSAPLSLGWSNAWADRAIFSSSEAGLEGMRVSVNLTDQELSVVFEPQPRDVPEARLEIWLDAARRAAQQSNFAGERAVLARARVSERTGRPVIDSHWTRDEVDHAALTFGSWLQRQLGTPAPHSGADNSND